MAGIIAREAREMTTGRKSVFVIAAKETVLWQEPRNHQLVGAGAGSEMMAAAAKMGIAAAIALLLTSSVV